MKKYIIVGTPRSGTTITHLAIMGHPNVSAIRDEIKISPLFTQGMTIFTMSGDKYLTQNESQNHIRSIFNSLTLLNAKNDTCANGLKVTAFDLNDTIKFVNTIQSFFSDTTIILTTRNDLVAQYGSVIRAKKTNKWHSWRVSEADEDLRFSLEIPDFLRYADQRLKIVKELKKLKSSNEFIEVNYEKDILPNDSFIFLNLFKKLDLPQVEITWLESNKVAPPPEKYIINYNQLKEYETQLVNQGIDSFDKSVTNPKKKSRKFFFK